jgi:hypothetical protein
MPPTRRTPLLVLCSNTSATTSVTTTLYAAGSVPCYTGLYRVQFTKIILLPSVFRFRSGAPSSESSPSPYVSLYRSFPFCILVSPPAHPSTCGLYIRYVDEIPFSYEFKRYAKSESLDMKRVRIARGGCFPALTTILLFCVLLKVLLCVSYEFQRFLPPR